MNMPKQVFLLLVLAMLARVGSAQEFFAHPEPSQALADKWAWALDQGANREQAWIVYQFPTTLDERYVAQNHFANHFNYNGAVRMFNGGNQLSLNALRAGVTDAKQGLLTPVDLLLIARVDNGELNDVEITTAAKPVHWRNTPVYWLDTVSQTASFRHLGQLLNAAQTNRLNRSIVQAIALHAHSDRTTYLYSLYRSEQWAALRPTLIAGLAMQKSSEVENLLLELLTASESEEEKRVAIAALSRYESPLVFETLLGFTEGSTAYGLREEAIEALGQFNSEESRNRLNEIAWSEAIGDLRETAVESLSKLDDSEANAYLLEIARSHPNRKTRGDALEELQENLL